MNHRSGLFLRNLAPPNYLTLSPPKNITIPSFDRDFFRIPGSVDHLCHARPTSFPSLLTSQKPFASQWQTFPVIPPATIKLIDRIVPKTSV